MNPPQAEILLFHFFLAFAAFSIVDGNNTSAYGAGVYGFLLFHELFQTMRLHKTAVFYKTCLAAFIIAFFKVFHQLTWILRTFKTAGQRFSVDTVLYFTFAIMLWFSLITIQTPGTWFFMVTVPVTDFTVHSARGEHIFINVSFWHFHS